MTQKDESLLDDNIDLPDDDTVEDEDVDMDNTEQKEEHKLEVRRKLEDILEAKRIKKQLDEDDDLD